MIVLLAIFFMGSLPLRAASAPAHFIPAPPVAEVDYPAGSDLAGETTTILSSAVLQDSIPQVDQPIPDQDLDMGSDPTTINLASYFSDPDGEELEYGASTSPSGIVSASVSGSTLTLTPLAVGDATITVTAADSADGEASDVFSVTVNPAPNLPPVVEQELSDLTQTEGDPPVNIDVSGVFSDPDDDPLTLSASSSNSTVASASISGGQLTVTITSVGTATITVTADDGNGGSVDETFNVTVSEKPNGAPTVQTPIPDQTMVMGGSDLTINVANVFTDPDNDPLTFSANSSNPGVATESLIGNTLTVSAVAIGQATITVTANDGQGGTVSDNFTVTVNPAPNRSPVVADPIEDVSLQRGAAALQVSLGGVFTDPDDDPLSFNASSSAALVASVSVSGSTLLVTPLTVGSAQITVTASDGRGGTVSDVFTVTVTPPPNQPPVVAQNLDDLVRTEGDPEVKIDVGDVFDDPDNDPLTYTASSSNNNVASTSIAGEGLTVTIGIAGTATITVTARDGRGGSVSEIFDLTVNERVNGAPYVNIPIPDREMELGGSDATINIANVFSDPDNDPLTLSASSSDTDVATVVLSGSLLTIRARAAGETTITVRASDGQTGTAEERFKVTVLAPNRSPVIEETIEDQQVARGGTSISFALDEVFSDPDGDPLSLSATSSAPSVATVTLQNTTLTLTPIGEGETVITITASDGRGGTTSTQFSVTVTPPAAVVETRPASDVNSTVATLNGSINPTGVLTQYHFEYGPGDTYGETTPERSAGSGTRVSPVAELITGLTPNTTYHYRIVARNARGNISYGDDEVFVTATGPNRSPEVYNPITDRTLTLSDPGLTIDLTTVFRDPDGDPLVFVDPVLSVPGIITTSIATNILTIRPQAEGQTIVTVEARDDEGAVSRDRFYVTVTASPNQSPRVVEEIEDLVFQPGDTERRIGLGSHFQDPDEDALTFEANSANPTVATVTVETDTLRIIPQGPGESGITVTAMDDREGSVALQFTVQVLQDPNQAPVVRQSLADTEMQLGAPALSIDVTTVFEDPDEDPISLTVQSGNPGIASAEISGNQLVVTAVAAGQTTITLTAMDDRGASAQDVFTLTVTAPGELIVAEVDYSETVTAGASSSIRARIDGATSSSDVLLYYRTGGNATFSSTEMNLNGSMFEAAIPAGAVTSNGVQWYIEARNGAGTPIRSDLLSFRVEHAGFTIQQPGGDEQNAYRLISSPLELAAKNASAVLEDDLGGYDDAEWRFFTHTGGSQFREGPQGVTFEPGRSYWLITRANATISTGSGLSIELEDFGIDLESGCNFIASPFSFPIPVSQVSLNQGEQVSLWAYNGQWNPDVRTLQPGAGYVACTLEDDRMVISPFPPTGAGKRSTAVAPVLDWAIRVRAQSQQAIDAYNYAAVSAAASEGFDNLDWIEPPVIGSYVSALFRSGSGKGVAQSLSTDVRPGRQDGYIWNLEVRSNIEDRVDLQFDQIDGVPSDLEVWLVDDLLQVRQNLREDYRYSFAATGDPVPRQLQLVVGKPGFLKEGPSETPDRFEVDQNHPNPFSSITTIRYQIPEEEPVTVTIYDILGKEIVILEESPNKTAGRYTITWDGRDSRGIPVASGTYLCRIQTRKHHSSRVLTLIR